LSYYNDLLLNTADGTVIARDRGARRIALCASAAAAAGAVYLNALQNPFVYDDFHTVVDNPSIHTLANLRAVALYAVTRPLVNLSYAIDYAIWGGGPFGFHVTSIVIHMLNVALLFAVTERLAPSKGRPYAAFCAASVFAVHPLMTEAVGYVSGRSEELCAALFLAALLCGMRWLRDPRPCSSCSIRASR
jgi:hypothetical protein